MPDDPNTLTPEAVAAAARDLSPEELFKFVAGAISNLPEPELIFPAMAAWPLDQQLAALQKLVGAVHAVTEAERSAGRVAGADLVNGLLRNELTLDQVFETLAGLPPLQAAEARSILSLVAGINSALNRVTTGEAPVALDLPADADGYYDRRCPAPDCRRGFKIHSGDWAARDFAEVRCPYCGRRSVHGEFDTPTQQEHVRHRGLRLVEQEVRRALPGVPFDVTPLDYELPRDVAVVVERALTQRLACGPCGCRYAAIGATFYCPACGHSDAGRAFATALETVRKTIESVPALRATVAGAAGEDAAENVARKLCENGVCDVVAAFEHFAKHLFDAVPNRAQFTPRPAVFQNLPDSSKLWRDAIGRSYEDLLTPAEWTEMNRLFQQRHKLIHSGGVVDQKYVDTTRDPQYVVGQRLVVREGAPLELARIAEKLAAALRAELGI